MSTSLNLHNPEELLEAKSMLIDCFFAEIVAMIESDDPITYELAIQETQSVLSDFRKQIRNQDEISYIMRECYKSAESAFKDYRLTK